ncbi:MAG: hypothetical protein M3O62_17880, partial [Pseudomonadota bacterium]|nr:hypothetical protein [Pseudomonadota bacterium]
MLVDDDLPDLPDVQSETGQKEWPLALWNSRPLDVYRHTDHPEYKRVIGEAINQLFLLECKSSETLMDTGFQAIRVSNGNQQPRKGGGEETGGEDVELGL